MVISYSHGYDLVATAFSQTILSITTGTPVTDHERKKIDRYLSRLNLDPEYVHFSQPNAGADQTAGTRSLPTLLVW